ncbi:MAG TPA: CHAT domain-containing tetratricopeptide repeat protein [Pyrinomonadaceae bacterium]|jgi:CHAT domain-containing protein/Tfp pilus assembly protein PilF|nr:CHAT domain-containing tetratricopeptide repeat protein [Pyrinomonadaceae bacterium]
MRFYFFGTARSHLSTIMTALGGRIGAAIVTSLLGLSLLPAAGHAQQPKETDQIVQLVLAGAKLQAAGDFDGAIAHFDQALTLAEKTFGPNDPLTALSLQNLGRVYSNKGEYAKAAKYLQRAVSVFEVSGASGRDGLGQSKHDLALAYDFLGDYSRAQPLYEQALAIEEEIYGPESREVARTLGNLANLYSDKADPERAVPMLERALAIRRKLYGPNHRLVAVMLNNLGGTYEALGNIPKAEEYFKQAISIAEQSGVPESLDLSNYLNNLGALIRIEDPKRARPFIERGLDLREKLLGHYDPDVAESLNNLALLDAAEGKRKLAEQRLLRALKILQDTFGLAHPLTLRVQSNLAHLSLANHQIKRALQLMASGSDYADRNLGLTLANGSEEQKRLYMATLGDGLSATISIHLKSAPANPEAARQALVKILRRKGRVLDVMSGQMAAVEKSDSEGQQMLTRLAAVRAQLSTLVLRGPERNDLAEYKAAAAHLQEQSQTLEKLISERVTAAGVSGASVTIANVQAAIPKGAMLVEMIQYRPLTITLANVPRWSPPRYAAYLLRHTGPPQWVELGEAAKIDQDTSRLRAALRDPRSLDFMALARTVDKELMQPVRKLLGTDRQILISPDGALSLIPFAALVDENNRFLVEHYTFSYLTSGRDLLRMGPHSSGSEGPMVFANPLFEHGISTVAVKEQAENLGTGLRSAGFSGHFDALEGSESEAREVSAVLPGAQLFTGEQATESAIKNLKGPSILHIATHGFFLGRSGERANGPAENPLLRSGLALTGANQLNGGNGDDGILTALEVSGLDLHGTQLVVLSACETGLGQIQNGEGVYGLRRALVLAGSESQIISLWKVDDEATRELMVHYYKLLESDQGRAASVREVQLQMLHGNDYKHPFYWAGFILSGKWGPLEKLGK